MNSFYTNEELLDIGFKKIGKNVLISRNAQIYGVNNIEIGDNVRIDDFCILSGKIILNNYIHIAAGCQFFAGDFGIELKDFTTTSGRVSIYAITDDYSGETLTNPTVPNKFKSITGGKVVLEKHVIIGTGSTILPGVKIKEGAAIGAMSLINKSIDKWSIYAGIPARKINNRSTNLQKLEIQFLRKKENES